MCGSNGSWLAAQLRAFGEVDHPLRVIRSVVSASVVGMSVELDALYSPIGRESIPPE